MSRVTIAALYRYPVKSTRGLALHEATVRRTGIVGDRQWMIVDGSGYFVTQRQKAELALIGVRETPAGVVLSCGEQTFPLERERVVAAGDLRPVTVWKDQVTAYDCGDEAAAFLAATVGANRGRPLRLVLVRELRTVSSKGRPAPQAEVAFADDWPFLVTSEESLAELKERIEREHPGDGAAITMERFRPNIVLRGLPPFAEDDIDSFRTASGLCFQLAKPCTRCVTTMTDPATAARGAEPLRTLRTFRQRTFPWGKGLMFGENAVLTDGDGRTLTVGDEVAVVYRA